MNQQTIGQLPAVFSGEVVGVDANGQPMVRWADGRSHRAALAWQPTYPDWAKCTGLRVILSLIDGDESQPMIIGLADAPPAPAKNTPDSIHLEAGKEFVIQCGKSKIALRADGRIEIRGGHLISRSSGPNKIKGGSVFIN
ncbi:MAG: hypothetical protein ACI841_004909 [Planctomycetota bacterium]|jgi:hypothetical protein